MASLPLIGGCAEFLLIVHERYTFAPIGVFYAHKAASSPSHLEGENTRPDKPCFPIQ